jgi:flagellar biosynthetic protein FliQ
MAVGIVISILQAITQINEQTLTFIPKMIAVILTLVIMAPWMLRVLQDYAISIFGGAGEMIH